MPDRGGRGARSVVRARVAGGRVVGRVPPHLEPRERSGHPGPALGRQSAGDGDVGVGSDRDGAQDLEHAPAGDPRQQHRAVRLLDAQRASTGEVGVGVGASAAGTLPVRCCAAALPLRHGQEGRPARGVRGAVVHDPPGVAGAARGERPDRRSATRRRAARRRAALRRAGRRSRRLEHEGHLHDEVHAVADEPQQVELDARPRPRVVGRSGRRGGRRDVEGEGQPRHVAHGDPLDGVPPPRGQPGVQELHELRRGRVRPPYRHTCLPGPGRLHAITRAPSPPHEKVWVVERTLSGHARGRRGGYRWTVRTGPSR